MADRFPLIINSVDQQIQELSSGDNLDLTGNNLINANHIQTSDMDVVGVMTATKLKGDGSELENLPATGGTLEATASGTLSDGSKVIVNTDGTVSVVAQTETTGAGTGSATVFEGRFANGADYISAALDSNSNRVVLFYRLQNSYDGTAIVGEISGGTITFGSPVIFDTHDTSAGAVVTAAAFDSTNNKVVVAYRKYTDIGGGGSTKYHEAKVGTVDPSNNSIEFGAAEVINSNGESSDVKMVFDPSSGKIVVAYRDEGNSNHGTAKVGTITVGASPSNDTISFGSAISIGDGVAGNLIAMAVDTSNNRIVIASQSSVVYVHVGEVDGTNINFGSPTAVGSNTSSGGVSIAFDESTNKVVVVRTNNSGVTDPYAVYAYVGTVDPNDNSINIGSGQLVAAKGSVEQSGIAYDSGGQKLIIVYKNGNASWQAEYIHATVNPSNDTITFSSATNYDSNNNNYFGVIRGSNDGQSLIFYRHDITKSGTAHVVGLTGFSVPQIGTSVDWETVDHTYFSSAVYDSTNNKVIAAYWATKGSQNGYGWAAVGTVSGTSISFGTPAIFNSDYSRDIRLAYDSTNSKVIIAFKDSSNYYGKAVVGEVSGTDITFGTPVAFNSERTNKPIPVYDSTNNKVVIVWEAEWSSSHARARVGEISGTSISFPSSSVTFNSNPSYHMGATFDSTNGKVVVGFQNSAPSNGHGSAIVLEVSGTTINYGSPVKFVTNLVDMPHELVHDPVNNKVVILYRNSGDGTYYGTAVVGTVSGTSISFNGSATVFNSTQVGFYSLAYDSNNGKVVIIYKDGDTNSGAAIAGTVSGDNIAFGSPFEIESGGISYVSVVYDSSNDKAVAVYNDEGNQYRVTATAFTPFTISSNLTAENYIGISDGAYTDGQTATVQLIGSVDDAQSSLTPGRKYYVQNDGTLSTTADTPSVPAGTAVAATKLMIKK